MISGKKTWKDILSTRALRTRLLAIAIFLLIVLSLFRQFLEFVESRKGVVFDDPLLRLFDPVELSWLTFALVYGGIIATIAILRAHPLLLLRALLSYALMVIIRGILMFALPLDPPPTAIPLVDPLVQLFGSGTVLTRDLFFSGHTATMVVMGLSMPSRLLKSLFFAGAAAIAACVLLQHVHYAVDVLVAPLAAYAAYRAGRRVVPEPSPTKA